MFQHLTKLLDNGKGLQAGAQIHRFEKTNGSIKNEIKNDWN